MEPDCFDAFLQEHAAGRLNAALQQIIRSPDASYDALTSKNPDLFFLVNYVDAAVFQTRIDFLQAGKFVEPYIQPSNAFDAGWESFSKAKPELAAALNISFPVAPFRYNLAPKPIFLSDSGFIPLIHLEPCEEGFSSFLDAYKGKPALFTFETKSSFAQMLQYPEVVASLCEPDHSVYIMELYPEKQLSAQKRLPSTSLQPILFYERPELAAGLALFGKALSTSPDLLYQNLLYQICKRTLYCIQEQRLGPKRAAALWEKTKALDWIDPHKGLGIQNACLGPEPQDYLAAIYAAVATRRQPKKITPTKKLTLAHIVPQLVEEGHAPTQLVENLTRFCDRQRFTPLVISTERLTFHPLEYPFLFICSERSSARAGSLIQKWHESGIQTILAPENLTYEETGRFVASLLHDLQVDIALFHGPDSINTFCANMTDVPLRALFEHGSQPEYKGFDLVIASSPDAPALYNALYENLGMQAEVAPFAINPRASWQEPAPTKRDLGIPEEAFVLTTISNHLDARLGSQFCLAVAKILKRCPQAIYAPIGRVDDKERIKAYFKKEQVDSRLLFLGEKDNPSQCARAMQLYLNEFPFGSGLGILDAMASGCPVVSMYDPAGPQQARYGGVYMGLDRVITTGDPVDYVALACSLIENPTLYAEWQKASLEQYAQRSDVQGYVKKIEEIILKHLLIDK